MEVCLCLKCICASDWHVNSNLIRDDFVPRVTELDRGCMALTTLLIIAGLYEDRHSLVNYCDWNAKFELQ